METRNSNIERPKNAGRLSVKKLNFQVPAKEGAREVVKEMHGEHSWRNQILHFLHSHTVQYTLMFLFFLDVIILFIEIFLVGHYPPCDIVERDCLACCPSGSDGERFLSGEVQPICKTGYDAEFGIGSCDGDKWHTVHTVENVLFGFTITILSVFVVEIHAEMIALGPAIFFRQVFYLLDYVIIVVSTTLELLFFFYQDELALSSISGLIIFARVWRFIRIGHAIVEVTTEFTHRAYEDLLTYAETLEADLKKHNLPLPTTPKSLHRKQLHGEDETAES